MQDAKTTRQCTLKERELREEFRGSAQVIFEAFEARRGQLESADSYLNDAQINTMFRNCGTPMEVDNLRRELVGNHPDQADDIRQAATDRLETISPANMTEPPE